MKILRILVIAGILTLGAASLARAAPLNYHGTLTLLLGEFGPGRLPGGGVATVNGSGGSIGAHLNTLRLAGSRGGPTGNFINVVTDPEGVGNGVAGISYINIHIGTGTLAPISGGAGSATELTRNVLPVRGMVKICLLTSDCATFLPLVLTQKTDNGATIGVGIGGLLTIGGGGSPLRMSIEVAPWTIKTATVYDHITTVGGNQTFIPIVNKGFAHDPSSGTTATVQTGGVVQLVSPAQVWTNMPFGSNAKQSSGQILLIHFVPEPGLVVLLGSGVAGLALLGRRRLRR